MIKRKHRKKPLNYTIDTLGRYMVEAFDKNGNKVDERYVDEFTRRGAYFEILKELKPHFTWDATRIKNI